MGAMSANRRDLPAMTCALATTRAMVLGPMAGLLLFRPLSGQEAPQPCEHLLEDGVIYTIAGGLE